MKREISEKYILMCELASEIQDQMKNFLDDLTVYHEIESKEKEFSIKNHVALTDIDGSSFKRRIFIPRQEQLQKIIKDYQEFSYGDLLRCFNNFYSDSFYDNFEEGWLDFVMINLYDKTWSEIDNNWIHSNEYHKQKIFRKN